jgi:hypothetical protein
MSSPWCAWCGRTVTAGVTVSNTVRYHWLCFERRASLFDPAKSN